VLRLLSKSQYGSTNSSLPSSSNPESETSSISQLPDLTASASWERTTTRQGKVCYVHHGHRATRWRAPHREDGEDEDEEGERGDEERRGKGGKGSE
jgi:hypothetical protein